MIPSIALATGTWYQNPNKQCWIFSNSTHGNYEDCIVVQMNLVVLTSILQ